MRKSPFVAMSLLLSGAAHSVGANPALSAKEFCETLPSSADPLNPIKGLQQVRGTALRKLIVGSVMDTPYGRKLWESSTYFGSDGSFDSSVHRGEVGGTYRIKGASVRETTDGGQETSFAFYGRSDGIIVAHITYHCNGDEVRNYCVSFHRPVTQ